MHRARALAVLAISLFLAAPTPLYAFDLSALVEKVQTFREALFTGSFLYGSKSDTQPYHVVYVPQNTKPQWAHAQTAGFGGGSGVLTTYYREVTPAGGGAPTGGTAATCPAGWTEVVHGYGPHYLGVIVYDLLVNGQEQGWYDDWWYPNDPGGSYRGPGGEVPEDTPPDDEDPPLPGEREDPPGGGGEGGEPGDPPPPPDGGGITPSGGPDPPAGGGDPEQQEPAGYLGRSRVAKKTRSTPRFINVAKAQTLPTGQEYFTRDIAIGSDSVCSSSQTEIVPFSKKYNNYFTTITWSMNSDACAVDQNTGATICNRCRVCAK